MPNWCSGVLKVRGKKKDLLNFLNNGIERHGYPRDESYEYTKYPLDAELDKFGDVFCKETDDEHHSWLYFKDSRRLFVDKNIEWYFSSNEDEEIIQVLDIKQAWCIDADYFVKISKQYNVDFKLMCFEQGCQFVQEIEVVKGNIKKNKTKDYKRYKNYAWSVYDPRLGG